MTEEQRKKLNEVNWYHTIQLENVITRGVDSSYKRLELLKLPDLTNKSVLDIGAWDGFFSFEAERRGANDVLAVDSFVWQNKTWGSKSGFNLAREVLRSNVRDLEVEVCDLDPKLVGRFDVVLFLGVLYHLKNPLSALEKIAAVTSNLLVLETHVDLLDLRTPAMRFYPAGELDMDPSNWWGPNIPAIEVMLKEVGFKKIEIIYPTNPALQFSWPYRVIRAIRHRLFSKRPFSDTFNQGRVVIHAWK